MDPAGIPAPGDVIDDKYCVEEVLGAGGMGVVVAARHLQLGQRVAIKVVRSHGAADSSATGRFMREARAAAGLTSEHVVRVLDVGTLPTGTPFMVMEHLAGVDLAHVLHRDGPLAVVDAVGFVLQACEAIAEAHAQGIVHRDLKPANLFVTHRMDGSALIKVLDFGISKAALGAVDDGGTLTASGVVMGSPNYMSPEQVRSAKNVDARSDLWSLGVILYELLTGVCPFAGESLGDTLAKIVSEPAPPITMQRPDLPTSLAAAIHRCLQRRLDARVQSVGELASRILPFAPDEAALSVERIQRVSRLRAGSRPSHIEAFALSVQPSERPEAREATEEPWLRPSPPATHPPSRMWLPLMIGSAPVLVTALSLAGWLALRHRPAQTQPTATGTAPVETLPPDATAIPSSAPPTTHASPRVELETPAPAAFSASPHAPGPGASRSPPSPSSQHATTSPTPARARTSNTAGTKPVPSAPANPTAAKTPDYDHF
ncbi:MAG: protein kinase [Myxococcota bacterium]|nr:protein kinase [Myxococcota bacterium]